MSKYILSLCILIMLSGCTKDEEELVHNDEMDSIENGLREEVIFENSVFKVSYNEVYEQPNWIEYEVRDIVKVADRDGLRFYEVDSIHTSDDFDYIDNIWDRGHMAPAAAFTDSFENLNATFSFLNCALQVDKLNSGVWVELESQNRRWAREFGTLKVRIDLEFNEGHLILPTNAHVPSGFYKTVLFPDSVKFCYYFPNTVTTMDLEDLLIECQK